MVSAAAILFLYQQYLSASIKSNQDSLSKAREAFEPALIEELTRLDTRINVAEDLLSKHIAPSALFALIQSITLQNVQFTNYTYGEPAAGSPLVHISLTGKAKSFQTLALQSDLVGLNTNLKNALITGVALGADGDIGFKLDADIDARMVSYQEQLQGKANSGGAQNTNETVPPANVSSTTTAI